VGLYSRAMKGFWPHIMMSAMTDTQSDPTTQTINFLS